MANQVKSEENQVGKKRPVDADNEGNNLFFYVKKKLTDFFVMI